MMYNGNVIMMQLAMLMTTPPVVLAHLPYALLFGCAYAVFAWYWFVRTGVFYYFFLDHRRPYATLVYIALLAVLAWFYGLAYLIAVLVTQERNRWWTYPCVLLGTWSMLRCRAPNANRQTPAFMKRLFS